MHSAHGALAGTRSAASLPLRASRPPSRAASRRPTTTKAGLLDFLNPGAAKGGAKRGRAGELVDALLELTDGTEGGIKASPSLKAEVEELVGELEEYCPRAPLRSELIFGEWEVVFASKPQTAGGPFRSPLGRAVFPGQRATQTIAPPNLLTNRVSYRTLGIVPGAATQEGEIEPIDESTFQIVFPELDGKRKGGPARRVIQTAYLDEKVRVARFVPDEEDDEAEASFYVFRRVADVEDESSEEEEEEEETAPPPPRKSPMAAFGTQIFKKPGAATQAERSYKATRAPQQQPQQQRQKPQPPARAGTGTVRKGTQSDPAAARAAAKAAAEEQRQRSREQAAAAKAAAEEERARAREQAAAAKAAAEEERARAREQAAAAKAAAEEQRRQALAAAEAERAAQAQRRAAAREQYEELAGEAAEAADAARAAVAAVKAAERESAALLRQAAQARSVIERAQGAAERATAEFSSAQGEEVEAEQRALSLQRLVNQLEGQLREQAALVGPRLKK